MTYLTGQWFYDSNKKEIYFHLLKAHYSIFRDNRDIEDHD